MTDDDRWCAALNADENLAGSAPEATAYVLIEHPGPWPAKALTVLDPAYAAELGTLDATVGLIRRPTSRREARELLGSQGTEAGGAGLGRADAATAGSERADSAAIDSGHAGSTTADSGRPGSTTADPGHAGSSTRTAVGSEPAGTVTTRGPDREALTLGTSETRPTEGADGLPDRPYVAVSAAGRLVARRTEGAPAAAELAAALAALREGTTPDGWTERGWLVAVCTHARRDACCARLGRPLVDGLLAATDADRVWETTHLGGHRFAPTCLALPSHVLYGRVKPDWVGELVAALDRAEVVPGLMRGRSTYSPPLQVAEVEARRRLGVSDSTLRLLTTAADHDVTTSTWASGDQRSTVVVEARPGRPRQLSCGKDALESRTSYEVVAAEGHVTTS